jgi:hypothetical protein
MSEAANLSGRPPLHGPINRIGTIGKEFVPTSDDESRLGEPRIKLERKHVET